MNREQAVNLIDPTAKLLTWESPSGVTSFWVKGAGWETKLTFSEARAWEIALLQVTQEVSK